MKQSGESDQLRVHFASDSNQRSINGIAIHIDDRGSDDGDQVWYDSVSDVGNLALSADELSSLHQVDVYNGAADVEAGAGSANNNGNRNGNGNDNSNGASNKQTASLSLWHLICILSTTFAYGCIMTTLFLVTLPVECERIETEYPNVPKSVALGFFVAIAGFTQLISPLIGMLSDTYMPPLTQQNMGQRLPFLFLGVAFSLVGLAGQYYTSFERLWFRYGFSFFLHMIGLNITYAMMIALIPDQVPQHQTGVANGVLAFLLVTGSLFGFGLFHSFFTSVGSMYALYMATVVVSAILTRLYAQERDVQLTAAKRQRRNLRSGLMTSPPRTLRSTIVSPLAILKSMLYDPLVRLDCKTLLDSYTIDPNEHHDFFVVTVSRLFYYCGLSVQTFFLYFVHDIIRVTDDPESAVAYLAILGQVAGTLTTYPIGLISDKLGGRRKPFVYLACFLLSSVMVVMIFARTMHQMTILGLALGAANGIYLTMETSLAVDTLQKAQMNDESSSGNAQLLGIWGVAAFLGSALGPMIGGPLLYFIGDGRGNAANGTDPDAASYSLGGYITILTLSAVYFLGSAVSLRWVRGVQ